MKFNINNDVLVKLTPAGRGIVLFNGDEKMSNFKEDKDGHIKIQLWVLMSYFGKHFYLGCNPPFETEIELKN